MKKVLVIGSTVVDVIINVDHLPKKQEDVHVITQRMSLGGCAYNTSDMIRHFGVPYILFSPIGTGAYGDFVRARLAERNIHSPIPTPDQDNGCCYCFVEQDGERTFISYHGAEYLFEKEWFALIDPEEIDSVYICGLEIEETTGENIVDWLEVHPGLQIYFAPGPRINRIAPKLLARIFALHPILHLNEDEVCTFAAVHAPAVSHAMSTAQAAAGTVCKAAQTVPDTTCKATQDAADTACEAAQAASDTTQPAPVTMEQAARILSELTGNTVIVTLGSQGTCFYSDGSVSYVEGFPADQIDTIGAGDSHIGAVIACRQLGMSLPQAIRCANLAASKVVETEGALLPDDIFCRLDFSC